MIHVHEMPEIPGRSHAGGQHKHEDGVRADGQTKQSGSDLDGLQMTLAAGAETKVVKLSVQ